MRAILILSKSAGGCEDLESTDVCEDFESAGGCEDFESADGCADLPFRWPHNKKSLKVKSWLGGYSMSSPIPMKR